MKRLLFVTQARYWKWDNASRLRAKSIIEAFNRWGYRTEVFFLGRLDEKDRSIFAETISTSTNLSGVEEPVQGGHRLRELRWQFGLMPTREFVRSLLRRSALAMIPAGVIASLPIRPLWFFRGVRYVLDPSPFGYASSEAERAFSAKLVAFDPQIVCIRPDSTWILPACQKKGVPTLVDSQDVIFQRRASLMRGGLINNVYSSRSLEISMLKKASAILAIQLADRDVFQKLLPTTKVIHVGQPFNVVPCNRRDAKKLVFGFIASEGPPNSAALKEILETLWPQILQCTGGSVTLVLAGRVCAEVTAVPPNVTVLGVVRSVADFYNEVDVILSVVRFGGGLKFKTVEGMAYGKAIIATDCAAEGLSAELDAALIRANTNEAIIAAADALSKNAEQVTSWKTRAYEAARSHFSAESIYAELFDTAEQLAQPDHSTQSPRAR